MRETSSTFLQPLDLPANSDVVCTPQLESIGMDEVARLSMLTSVPIPFSACTCLLSTDTFTALNATK
jgi:hypothetical protein